MLLNQEIVFPPIDTALPDGLLAVGGDLSVERLLLAYRSGIFPWYNATEPILWWSPDPRMVLFPNDFKVSKSFRKVLKEHTFTITYNQDFKGVIEQCAQIKRNGQSGSWITLEMIEAYLRLHKLGHALSVEVWSDNTLVGGLYGIDLPEKKIFCGESMFSSVSNASKIALYHWVQTLLEKEYQLIDCQMHTAHLESLGAIQISREKFLAFLNS